MSRDNVFAATLFAISLVVFFLWGYGYIDGHHLLLFILASVFGLFMAFNIGGNDVANAFGTSVGAKTLTIKQALIIAAVFELSGAVFAGAEVTNTIRSGIVILPNNGDINPMIFAAVMLSALMSAGIWLFIATKKGLPVSTTHAIVGGIVGSALMMGYIYYNDGNTLEMVKWSSIGSIVLSWVISPVMGGVISYMVFGYIKTKIITPSAELQAQIKAIKAQKRSFKENYISELSNKSEAEQIQELRNIAISDDEEGVSSSPFRERMKEYKKEEKLIDAIRYMRLHIPILAAIAAMIISSTLLFKGLKHMNLNFSTIETIWILCVIGTVAYLVSFSIVNMMKKDNPQKGINRIFGWFQIFTASAFAFSHGANDIANAIGPFAAVLDVLKSSSINSTATIPTVAMVTFGVSLVVGLWFLGKEVITTVGSKLTEILPTTGFSAELSASIVILIATKMGLPISSTHVLIGAVLGIGLYNRNANWGMLKPIGLAWIITLPVAMIGSAIGFVIITKILGF
ncbi:inorganic phosphate transporter [Campylobacter lanienae]|uniref:Phosphate transporter n=1 Tax=Campylobacter lanienae TaxID=75658 RepID=A0ABY3G9W0_9BACT|nr:inorganic phosphate transporter [Campylobacter lanienae]MCI7363756.1 inorganic phosphate transporter [Campylobacter lanienae]TWO29722.1 inorganic phosphate transporter [Campylobacter lanienae]